MQSRYEYYTWVRDTAECVIGTLRRYPETDPSAALWETCDGQVVYYSDGATVMEHTDNPEAIDDLGGPSDVGVGGSWSDVRQRYAQAAFYQDVADDFYPQLDTLREVWRTANTAYGDAQERFDLYVEAFDGDTEACKEMWPVAVDLSNGVSGEITAEGLLITEDYTLNVSDEPAWVD